MPEDGEYKAFKPAFSDTTFFIRYLSAFFNCTVLSPSEYDSYCDGELLHKLGPLKDIRPDPIWFGIGITDMNKKNEAKLKEALINSP